MRTDELPQAHALLAAVRAHTARELAGAGLRLARTLQAADALAFAERELAAAAADGPREADGAALRRHPLALIAAQAGAATPGAPGAIDPALAPTLMSTLVQALVLLAALPEAHEGWAALCRGVHPQGLPWVTPALALRWLEADASPQGQDGRAPVAWRTAVQGLLCAPPPALRGLLSLTGDGPWHSRSLRLDAGVWAALQAQPPAAAQGRLLSGPAELPGLGEWLAEPATAQAVQALRVGWPCRIVLLGGDAAMRATRVHALLGAASVVALRCDEPGTGDGRAPAAAGPDATDSLGAALLVAHLHQAALWLVAGDDDGATPAAARPDPAALAWSLPVLHSARLERDLLPLPLPLLRVPVAPLAPAARRALWRGLLPQLGAAAGPLAARYPVEPDDAREVVRDLALRQALSAAPLAIDAVGDCIRERTPWQARPGVQRVSPRAGWAQLHLPVGVHAQLQAAVQRVAQQITVLDDWGYAPGPGGRRGVRLLFCGAPGTGKTLAAEVMARALGVHLLVVDLASLVSKWIGETEKNLAAVFDAAERARALLLFDEADALFGRRSEGSDANDRHANLETAYLLQRLEAYEGIAVLTTNLRAHLDSAFTRRFEFIVEFPEPDGAARAALWRLHLPPQAPLADDVDLAELAAWYALTGAQIRNAALGAAFAAAAEGTVPGQRHLLLAVEREFDKAGRAFPGLPPAAGRRWPAGPGLPSGTPPGVVPDPCANAADAAPQPLDTA